ncbi:MAG TPA: ABC transporter substrate-binding protein [Stellaceae bacterium]|nr:ABC transporter substrate-binding protein [Stellaceae bacterium]
MKMARTFAGIFALLLGLGLAPGARAVEDYQLHVILPLTGNAAFIGQEQQQMLELVRASVNRSGGIQGRDLRFVYHDDQTSPQVAVQLSNDVLATHPSVILGSAITAMCNAMAPLMQDGPVMYCTSPGIHPAAGSYVFSAFIQTGDLGEALVRYFHLKGWTRIAMLSSTDATGQDADRGIDHALTLPENAAVKMVEHPHFNATDLSVTAQIERIKAAGAQAMIAWTTGAQIATIFKGIAQAGLDIPVGTTPGNQQFQQLSQYVGFLPKQLLIPSASYPEHEGVITLDARVEQKQQEMYALLKSAKLRADNATGTAWDPALIVIDALRKLGPNATAAQIRDYIGNLTDFAGIDGIYDFKKVPQRGIGIDSAVLVTYDPKGQRWVWLSKPGGEPLKR